MPDIPEGAPRSDDGQWWWDGSDWKPVDEAENPAHELPDLSWADLEQYPEMVELLRAEGAIDTYLVNIGLDPDRLRDDEPA